MNVRRDKKKLIDGFKRIARHWFETGISIKDNIVPFHIPINQHVLLIAC